MAACRFSSCAVWSHGLGMQASPQDKLELRSDLTGVVLRATSETEPPFSQTRPAGGGLTWRCSNVTQSLDRLRLPRGQVWRHGSFRQVTVHQFYGDVWRVLQEATNFSFSMVASTHFASLLCSQGCPGAGRVC